jgi:hypothetical protein
VKLTSKEEVAKVVEELNGKEISGRKCFLYFGTNQADLWNRAFGNTNSGSNIVH